MTTARDRPSSLPPAAAESAAEHRQTHLPSARAWRIGVGIPLLLGLALTTALIGYYSFAAVGAAVWTMGWGLGPIVALHLVAVALCGIAWRVLFGPERPVSAGLLITLRWIRESVNTMLPVARVGGDIVGARLLVLRGTELRVAAASVVVDRTVEVLSQFLFAAAGVVVLAGHRVGGDLLHWSVLGLLAIAPVPVGLIVAQRRGLLRVAEQVMARLAAMWGSSGADGGLHETAWAIYRDRRRVALATLYHALSWLIGVVQIWLALRLMGHPAGWAEAFILESLSQAVCTAAFFMPAALGAQEAGYMLIARFLGIPPELGLALSLVKRLGDIVVDVPGLLVWQGLEGRRLWVLWKRTARRTERASTA